MIEPWLQRPWLILLAAVALSLFGWNLVGIGQTSLWLLREGAAGGDWVVFWGVTANDPYSVGGFHWAPPAAWLIVWLVQPLGLTLWQLLHIPALALLGDWRVVLVGLCSWAFWQDLANGNILTFVVVAAWWALRGNPVGIVSFLALTVLVPRPIMIPVLIAVLWHRRWASFLFAAIVLAVVGASVYTGQFDDFLARLMVPGEAGGLGLIGSVWNIAPSRIMGTLWVPIGAALALVLYRRGWIGMASVAIAPVVFSYYLLFLLLDVPALIGLLDRHRFPDRIRKLIGLPTGVAPPVPHSLDGAAPR